VVALTGISAAVSSGTLRPSTTVPLTGVSATAATGVVTFLAGLEPVVNLCDTTVVSLNPTYSVIALTPVRGVVSLVPVRRVRRECSS